MILIAFYTVYNIYLCANCVSDMDIDILQYMSPCLFIIYINRMITTVMFLYVCMLYSCSMPLSTYEALPFVFESRIESTRKHNLCEACAWIFIHSLLQNKFSEIVCLREWLTPKVFVELESNIPSQFVLLSVQGQLQIIVCVCQYIFIRKALTLDVSL